MASVIEENSDLKEAALALWDQGFHVIPLGTPNERPPDNHIKRCNGDLAEAMEKWPKTPRIGWKKYQTQAPTREEIEMWWRLWPQANIGLLTGSVIVVDADSKEAVEFVESGQITRTPWVVKTAKGAHFYYQRNPTIEIRNSASKQRLDVRGYGGYVVAPPSVHATGVIYEWEIDKLYGADSIHELPLLMADDLQKITTHNNQGAGVVLNFDANDQKPVPRGQTVDVGERNNMAASLAGRYIANGIPVAKVLQLVKAWNNNNATPLSDTEIETVVESIAKTHQLNTQSLDGRPDPNSLITNNTHTLFSFQNVGNLNKQTIEQPLELWGERLLFSSARMLIAGAPKIGKTNFNLELAIRLTTGGNMLGWSTAGPCRVAYLNAEVMTYYMRERISVITDHLSEKEKELVNANLFVTGRTDLDLLSASAFYAVFDEIERIKPDVIIFDPLINLHSAKENDSSEMMNVFGRLDLLADINKSALIIAHHVSKGVVGTRGHDPFDAIRGSGALRGWADTNIMLYRSDDMVMSAYEVRNGPCPDPMPIWFDRDSGQWKEGTEFINPENFDDVCIQRIDYVCELLAHQYTALSREEVIKKLMKQFKISYRSSERSLSEIMNDSRIESFRKGRERYVKLK